MGFVTQNRIFVAVWRVALLWRLVLVLVEMEDPGSPVLRVASAHFCK